MSDEFASRTLPKHRTGRHIRWLARWSAWQIGVASIGVYSATVLLFSVVEAVLSGVGIDLILDSQKKSVGFVDLLYFNFVTIMTIGYGDLSPVGLGRLFSVIEAIIGVAFFGLVVAVITSKLTSPPANTIVFSRYAYYCLDREGLLLVFVNTTGSLCLNVEMSAIFKLAGDWKVHPPIRTPFIGRSVQTFFVYFVGKDDLIERLEVGDVLRFGISGRIGDTAFAAAIEYSPEEMLVIPSRDRLTAFRGFWDADFSSEEVVSMFHYCPPEAQTMFSFVKDHRSV